TVESDDVVPLSQRRQRRRPDKTKTRTNTPTPRESPPYYPRRKTTGQHTPTQHHGSNGPHKISWLSALKPLLPGEVDGHYDDEGKQCVADYTSTAATLDSAAD